MRSRFCVTVFALALTGAITSCDDDDGITGIDESFEENATWVAVLNGANERPNPTNSPATGRAFFIDNGTSITYYIQYEGLLANASNAHIHRGTSEQSGAPIIQLPYITRQSGVVSGYIDMTLTDVAPLEAGNQSPDDLRTAFNNGAVYVNIHSSPQPPGFTGGEIRGQIVPR